MPANQQIICHIFHADNRRVCQITLSKFSIYTSTFYFAHSTLPYIFVNETWPYVLVYTSIFFYNKPTLSNKHCSWELSFTVYHKSVELCQTNIARGNLALQYTTNRSYHRRHLRITLLGVVHFYFRRNSITGHILIYRYTHSIFLSCRMHCCTVALLMYLFLTMKSPERPDMNIKVAAYVK